jgi:hypothetical protein
MIEMSAYFSKTKVAAIAIVIFALWLAALPVQGQTSGASTSPMPSIAHGKAWQQMSAVEKVQTVCAFCGEISFLVAEIWLIVAGFKTSVGWGLFMLFIGGFRSILAAIVGIGLIGWIFYFQKTSQTNALPFDAVLIIIAGCFICAGGGTIIFIVRHWERARKPLAVMGLNLLLLCVVLGLAMIK